MLSDQSNRIIHIYCKESIVKKIGRVKSRLDKCKRKKKGSANNSAEVFSNTSVLESRSSTSAASDNPSKDILLVMILTLQFFIQLQ